jgi:hypothetical protein
LVARQLQLWWRAVSGKLSLMCRFTFHHDLHFADYTHKTLVELTFILYICKRVRSIIKIVYLILWVKKLWSAYMVLLSSIGYSHPPAHPSTFFILVPKDIELVVS